MIAPSGGHVYAALGRLVQAGEEGWERQKGASDWLRMTRKYRVCLISQNDFRYIVNLDAGHRKQGGLG